MLIGREDYYRRAGLIVTSKLLLQVGEAGSSSLSNDGRFSRHKTTTRVAALGCVHKVIRWKVVCGKERQNSTRKKKNQRGVYRWQGSLLNLWPAPTLRGPPQECNSSESQAAGVFFFDTKRSKQAKRRWFEQVGQFFFCYYRVSGWSKKISKYVSMWVSTVSE